MPELRPMRVEDVPEVHDLSVLTFEALDASRGEPPQPRPDPVVAHIRYRHLVTSDPEGAWVAEHEGAIVGCALALRRADVYAEGARGRIVMASLDPRALRAYFRLGLDLHPALSATGTPKVSEPGGVREGDASDIPFTEAVDRHVRGAARGPDIGALLEMRQTLLIAPERGYAV